MLKLCIDNIGIVKDSEIELNGITAITGHNNSGKTTVGKALYSVVSSVEDLNSSLMHDKNEYVSDFVYKLAGDIMLRLQGNKEAAGVEQKLKHELYGTVWDEKDDAEDYLEYVQSVLDEHLRSFAEGFRESEKQKYYMDLYHSAEEDIQEIRAKLRQDFAPVDYVNAKLNNVLQMEFNEQILPMGISVESGRVQLYEDGQNIFDVILDQKGLQKRKETFSMRLFDRKAVFIDDVFVLDDWVTAVEKKREPIIFFRDFNADKVNYKIENHKQKLIGILRQKDSNLYSDMLNKEAADKIYNRLEGVFEDRIIFESGRVVCANSKLHIGNLAMGAKVFALLKMLLDNGTVTKDTVLILDEPEVHLHPEWQNILAELLVIIMQEVHATILLTTHSAQFLMALETYVKQYQRQDNFKVYTTERLEDSHFVKYVDRTDDIKAVYYKLSKPLFDIKAIKDSMEG